jgi:hypothetical protein
MAVLISYVNNGTIIVQSDMWGKNLVKLKLAYKIVFELTQSMGLVLEHNKSEGFHLSQKHGESNPDIDLGYAPYTGATPLHPGTTWRYLGFFFVMLSHSRSMSNDTRTRPSLLWGPCSLLATLCMDFGPNTNRCFTVPVSSP